MSAKKRILFVGDEPKILEGLRRSLRSIRQEWEMLFVASGLEALDILTQEPFEVIVSDMRMPGMNGAELLERVRQQYPYITRIGLTGQVSRASVLLCAGPMHRCLAKPVEAELPEEYGFVRTLSIEDVMPTVEAEQEILGATHAEVGAYLLGLWGFSNPVIEVIAFHHNPSKSQGKRFSAVTAVHVANVLANTDGQADQTDTKSMLDTDYLDRLALTNRFTFWQENLSREPLQKPNQGR